MTYRLPSLNAIRAFEASARHLSFKHAASELCVTAGAVSQQVKGLETAMGVALFKRLPSGLILTSEGEDYLAPISDAFKVISRATDAISTTLTARDFRLGVSSDLGPKVCSFFAQLKDQKTGSQIAVLVRDAGLEDVMDGRVDALLRRPIKAITGFHVDQIEVPIEGVASYSAALVLRLGTAGCREHELFLNAVSKR